MSDEQPKPIATVPAPPPRKPTRGLMIAPVVALTPQAPEPEQVPSPLAPAVPDNMSKPNSGLQDLNFKVDPSFHRDFKLASTYKGMSMKDLIEASFNCWVEHYGDPELKVLLRRK